VESPASTPVRSSATAISRMACPVAVRLGLTDAAAWNRIRAIPAINVLRLIATGAQEHMHNHIETTLTGGERSRLAASTKSRSVRAGCGKSLVEHAPLLQSLPRERRRSPIRNPTARRARAIRALSRMPVRPSATSDISPSFRQRTSRSRCRRLRKTRKASHPLASSGQSTAGRGVTPP
jgi:hypothetical protein